LQKLRVENTNILYELFKLKEESINFSFFSFLSNLNHIKSNKKCKSPKVKNLFLNFAICSSCFKRDCNILNICSKNNWIVINRSAKRFTTKDYLMSKILIVLTAVRIRFFWLVSFWRETEREPTKKQELTLKHSIFCMIILNRYRLIFLEQERIQISFKK
jgi:hypothetical protein